MMILVSLLATTGLITLTAASPMPYATYRRREMPVDERPELLLLYDERALENKDSSPDSVYNAQQQLYSEAMVMPGDIQEMPNEDDKNKNKRSGFSQNSLSIVNPVDVLRARVMLELARRRLKQNELQVASNRRFLENIGKRSIRQNDYTQGPLISKIKQQIPIDRTSNSWYQIGDSNAQPTGNDVTRTVLSTSQYNRDTM